MPLPQNEGLKFPRYWIDGFIPDTIQNSQYGVLVEGVVWVVDGQKPIEMRFLAHLPQKLLHKKIDNFKYGDICLDLEQGLLEFEIISESA